MTKAPTARRKKRRLFCVGSAWSLIVVILGPNPICRPLLFKLTCALVMSSKQHIFRSKWPDAEVPQVVLTRFIADVLEDADHGHGNKVAFVDAANPERKITYKQFKKLACQVCAPSDAKLAEFWRSQNFRPSVPFHGKLLFECS